MEGTGAPPPLEGRWIGEAAHAAREELRLYARTWLAIVRGPRRFGELWGDGHLQALNPLGFAGTTLALVTVTGVLFEALPGATDDASGHSLLGELLKAGGTYVHLAALGVLTHFLLKVLRGRRLLLGSVGLALYAGGVAATTTSVLMVLVGCLVPAARPVHHLQLGVTPPLVFAAMMTPLVLSFGLFVWLLASAMAGLHRRSRAATVAAVLFAFIGTGFFFGLVDPPGDYGLRLELKVRRESSGALYLGAGLAFS
jgi:hypothetical protein